MKVSVNTLLRLCSYMSLAICFMPVVDYYCPWYITMIPALLVLGITLVINHDVFDLLIALLYITGLAFLILWFIKRRDPLFIYFVNFYITFLPVLLSVQLNKVVADDTFFRDYLRMALIFVAITCVTTMVGHEQYPMASRELASGTAVYDTDRYRRINIGGYEFIYSLVLFIPVISWMRATEKTYSRKLFYTIVLVLGVLCIYSSQYTIALVCTVVAFFIMWMMKDRRNATIAAMALIVFLMLNGLSLLSRFFYWASQNVGMPYVADRLLQVSQLLAGKSVDTDTSDARIMHYKQQIASFAQSPLFGNNLLSFNTDAISGHSLVLDMLGAGGILGALILFWLFRGLYRAGVTTFATRAVQSVRAVWLLGTIIAILNPVVFGMIITVAFPCCMSIDRVERGGK